MKTFKENLIMTNIQAKMGFGLGTFSRATFLEILAKISDDRRYIAYTIFFS